MILLIPISEKCPRSPYKDDHHAWSTIMRTNDGDSVFCMQYCTQCRVTMLSRSSAGINWEGSSQYSFLTWTGQP